MTSSAVAVHTFPMHWDGESIWQAVMALAQERADTRLAGFSVEVLPCVDSTNTELMRRARAGQTEATLLVAEQQTAGRGRLGRSWESGQDPAVGDSLTFSLGLMLSPASWDGLSLAVGVCLAENLAENLVAPNLNKSATPQQSIGLKWPNDLWLQGCKLAGILIETMAAPAPMNSPVNSAAASASSLRYAVIGIGVNIAPRPAQGLSTPPAWLQALQPGVTAPLALARVAIKLLQGLLAFEAQGFAPFAPRFAARDALYSRSVSLSDGRSGVAKGVDGRGALLVHTARGLERVASAEVSVRPVQRPGT